MAINEQHLSLEENEALILMRDPAADATAHPSYTFSALIVKDQSTRVDVGLRGERTEAVH